MASTLVDTPRSSGLVTVQRAATFPTHHYESFVVLARTLSPQCIVPTESQLHCMCTDSVVFYIEANSGSRSRVAGMARVIVLYKLTKIEAELHDVVVLPEYRSKGYARLLVEKAIEYARESDAQRIVLTSRDNKEGAQTLYRSVGFLPVERQSPMFELVL